MGVLSIDDQIAIALAIGHLLHCAKCKKKFEEIIEHADNTELDKNEQTTS